MLPLGDYDGLVGQALAGDGAEDDEAVVVAADGAVGAVSAGAAARAVPVLAAVLAAGLAVAPHPCPVAGDAWVEKLKV